MHVHFLRYPWGISWAGLMLFRGPQNVLIDSGLPETVSPWLEQQLADLGLKLTDLDWVLTTHAHDDHFGGNPAIHQASPRTRFAAFRDSRETIERVTGIPLDRILDDGDTLDCGDYTLTLLHTPGHSPDSCSFLDSQTGTLFTGDSFEGHGSVYTQIALYQNPELCLQSIRKVRALAEQNVIRRICTGHDFFSNDGDAQGKANVLAFLDTCEKTIRNYDQTIRTLRAQNPDISPEALGEQLGKLYGIEDNPPIPEAPRWTVLAHLNHPIDTTH